MWKLASVHAWQAVAHREQCSHLSWNAGSSAQHWNNFILHLDRCQQRLRVMDCQDSYHKYYTPGLHLGIKKTSEERFHLRLPTCRPTQKHRHKKDQWVIVFFLLEMLCQNGNVQWCGSPKKIRGERRFSSRTHCSDPVLYDFIWINITIWILNIYICRYIYIHTQCILT